MRSTLLRIFIIPSVKDFLMHPIFGICLCFLYHTAENRTQDHTAYHVNDRMLIQQHRRKTDGRSEHSSSDLYLTEPLQLFGPPQHHTYSYGTGYMNARTNIGRSVHTAQQIHTGGKNIGVLHRLPDHQACGKQPVNQQTYRHTAKNHLAAPDIIIPGKVKEKKQHSRHKRKPQQIGNHEILIKRKQIIQPAMDKILWLSVYLQQRKNREIDAKITNCYQQRIPFKQGSQFSGFLFYLHFYSPFTLSVPLTDCQPYYCYYRS